MSVARRFSDSSQVLERLSRSVAGAISEAAAVASAGERAAPMAVKIKSCLQFNVYSVRAVEVGSAGIVPVEYGDGMQAVNLAEDFTGQGELSAGTYAVMHRVGDKNVFYAKP